MNMSRGYFNFIFQRHVDADAPGCGDDRIRMRPDTDAPGCGYDRMRMRPDADATGCGYAVETPKLGVCTGYARGQDEIFSKRRVILDDFAVKYF
jgi:hypothetical protein